MSSVKMLIAVGVAVTLSAIAGTVAAEVVPVRIHGGATLITMDGVPTPVYRLAVVTDRLPFGAQGPEVEVGHALAPGELTESQLAAHEVGLFAACHAAGLTDVIAMDEIGECQHPRYQPVVGVSGPTVGPSSGLAEAMAAAAVLGDYFGDYTVAATGSLSIDQIRYEGAVISTRFNVHQIGGVPQKAAAAAAAGVDILLVPIGNYLEFSASPELAEAGVQILAVDDVRSGLIQVCAETKTAMCRERVLLAE